MIVRAHKCQRCRRPWVTFGVLQPDDNCPFCWSRAINSTVVSR